MYWVVGGGDEGGVPQGDRARALTVVENPFGTVTVEGLIYRENGNVWERGEYPIQLAPTTDARETWQATLRHIAYEGRCFVLGCNQYFAKSIYPEDLQLYEELADLPEDLCRGGSAIVDSFGEYVCHSLYGREGMLLADLQLSLNSIRTISISMSSVIINAQTYSGSPSTKRTTRLLNSPRINMTTLS